MTARTIKERVPEGLDSYLQSASWQIHDIHEGLKEADAGEFATDEQVKAVFEKYSVRACG